METLEDVAIRVNGIAVMACFVHLVVKSGWQRRSHLYVMWQVYWGLLALTYAPFVGLDLQRLRPELVQFFVSLGALRPVLLLLISSAIDPPVGRVGRLLLSGPACTVLGLAALIAAPWTELPIAVLTAWALVRYGAAYQAAMPRESPLVPRLLYVYAVLAVLSYERPTRPDGQWLFILATLPLNLALYYTADGLLNRGREGRRLLRA